MFLAKEELHHFLRSLLQCRTLAEVKRAHAQFAAARYSRNNTLLANTLVHAYGNVGALADARNAFAAIHSRNAFSWNILIAAHVRNSRLDGAGEVFAKMPCRDAVSYNTLMAASARAGKLKEASDLFQELPTRDLASWNTMVAVLAERGYFDRAKALLDRSPRFSLASWTAIMAACARQGRIDLAQRIFDGLPEPDAIASTILFAAYAQAGDISRARYVFDRMDSKDAASWTAMIAAYAGSSSDLQEARNLFDRIQEPDTSSYNALIAAYAQRGQMLEARELLDAMPCPNQVSWTATFSGYAKLGDIGRAREIFDAMPDRDVIAWNAMICGYSQSGRSEEALDLFKLMIQEGIQPERETFVCAIDASATAPAEREGKIIHAELVASGIRLDSQAQNALLTMYGKFGDVAMAKSLFDATACRDHVTWSAMLAAYAQNGHPRVALGIFHGMLLDGVAPDGVTFVHVLATCAHSGMVRTGWLYFMSMTPVYGVDPEERHFVCMVDMLARSGEVCTAGELARRMPYHTSTVAWMSMAGACRDQGDTCTGEDALEYALDGHVLERGAASVALWSQMSCLRL